MTDTSSNSEARKKRLAELRASIRSCEGKIERRRGAILFAQRDIREQRELVIMYERELAELGAPRKRR